MNAAALIEDLSGFSFTVLYPVAHHSECNEENGLCGGVLTYRDLGVDLSRYCNYYALFFYAQQ